MMSILRLAMIVANLLATLGCSATVHEHTIRAGSADDRHAGEPHVHEEHAHKGQVHEHSQNDIALLLPLTCPALDSRTCHIFSEGRKGHL
jgi:hypothetical protein